MSQQIKRTDYAAGPAELLAAMISNYTCGHCPSDTSLRTDDHGMLHLVIAHDDDCPVLRGHLSAAPDAIRAATNTP